VDFALDQHNAKLVTDADKKKMESVRSEIIAGKIKVPDYYLQMRKK
jgi:basic membrane protein A